MAGGRGQKCKWVMPEPCFPNLFTKRYITTCASLHDKVYKTYPYYTWCVLMLFILLNSYFWNAGYDIKYISWPFLWPAVWKILFQHVAKQVMLKGVGDIVWIPTPALNVRSTLLQSTRFRQNWRFAELCKKAESEKLLPPFSRMNQSWKIYFFDSMPLTKMGKRKTGWIKQVSGMPKGEMWP